MAASRRARAIVAQDFQRLPDSNFCAKGYRQPFWGTKLAVRTLPTGRTCIAVRSLRGVELVPVREVRYFLADQKYVTIHYGEGETIARESLSGLELEFGRRFLRVHRSVLVAVRFIDQLLRPAPRCYELKLIGLSERLPVSRRRAADVRVVLAGRARQAEAEAQREASAPSDASKWRRRREWPLPPRAADEGRPVRQNGSASAPRSAPVDRWPSVQRLGGRNG